jgi:hypothetical protein
LPAAHAIDVNVRKKEEQADSIARILDTALSIPGFRSRVGFDPLVGLFPIVGDLFATIGGAAILVIARQLHVSRDVQLRMAYNLLKNGLIGTIPLVGDVYSFFFKSHQLNAALLIRSVKRGEDGQCLMAVRSLTVQDITVLTLLILPIVLLVLAASLWFWNHDVSLLTFIYPTPYQSRIE